VFLSTFASTQFQAMQMAFFTFLPQILLSGFMFPYAGMPKAAQWIAEILPLTHFIRLIRGIMLRAAGLDELRRELWILLGFTVLMLAIATLRFRKRLDCPARCYNHRHEHPVERRRAGPARGRRCG